jgi:hypothetical protein
MTGYAAEPDGVLIVQLPCDGMAPPQADGNDPGPQRSRRPVHRLLHPERLEDPLCNELIERPHRHAFHDPTEEHGVEVAVLNARPGWPPQRLLEHETTGRRRIGRELVQGHERPQPGAMLEEVPHGHVLLSHSAERWQITLDWGVELDPSGVHEEHHGGRRGDDLRERRQVVQRAVDLRHPAVRGPREMPIPACVERARASADDDDGAGEDSLADGGGYRTIDLGGAGQLARKRDGGDEGHDLAPVSSRTLRVDPRIVSANGPRQAGSRRLDGQRRVDYAPAMIASPHVSWLAVFAACAIIERGAELVEILPGDAP